MTGPSPSVARVRLDEIHAHTIKRSATWRALEVGTLREEHYAGLLREWYHYTQHSGGVLEGALLPHLVPEHRALVQGILRHGLEEEAHYRLCENDLANMGRDREALRGSRPLPLTEALGAVVYARMQHGDALIAYFGHRLNLEHLGASLGTEAVARFGRAMPGAASNWFSFLRAHAAADDDHVEEALATFARCRPGPDAFERMLEMAATSATLYAAMLDGALQAPWPLR